MSDDDQGGGGDQPALQLELDRLSRRRDHVDLRLRLRNPHPDRALHYVAGVRAIRYDADADAFEVQLTDTDLEPIPGAAKVLPPFGMVDPGGTSVLTLRLPDAIVRMLPGTGPDGEVQLERVEIGPTSTVHLVVGWSDTAFYPDPRERSAAAPTLQGWERGRARLTVPPVRPSRR